MGSKSVATLTLVLRIFTFFFAVASFLFLLKNKIEFKQNEVTFKFGTYRYVFYTAVIAAVYALLQIPFAIYKLKKDERMIDFLRKFDFYADGLITLLLGTGVEAGFAVTNELKKLIDQFYFVKVGAVNGKPAFKSFLNKVNGGTGLLLGAFICMIVLLGLSFAHRNATHRNARNVPNDNGTASIQF